MLIITYIPDQHWIQHTAYVLRKSKDKAQQNKREGRTNLAAALRPKGII